LKVEGYYEPGCNTTNMLYKKDSDGCWFSYVDEFGPSKVIFSKIETNITVDNKTFEVDDGVFQKNQNWYRPIG
jgi:hypothetical protein